MADQNKKTFSPFDGESEIYLQQISENDAQTTTPDSLFTITVPENLAELVVGVIAAAPLGFEAWAAYIILLVTAGLVAALIVACLWRIFRSDFDMTAIIREDNGKASLSRIQALIFTMIVSGAILATVMETGHLPDEIPLELLYLMAGSLSAYLGSKYIQTRNTGNGLTPSQSQPAATGSIIRYGKGDAFELDPKTVSVSQEEYTSSIHVSPATAGNASLVAVAVGETKLAISSGHLDEDISEATLIYVDDKGEAQTVKMIGPQTITTQPKAITEVLVSFRPKGSKNVNVPVKVKTLP